MDAAVPHPERFQTYTLLPGGRAFMIPNNNFVFQLDLYNGWRDEYGHYYNSNGQPECEPQDEFEESPEIDQSFGPIEEENEYDALAPNYHSHPEHSSSEIKKISAIHRNLELLSKHPSTSPLRVHFSNMSYKELPEDILKAYKQRINGILNIIFYLDHKNRRNGKGYFVVLDSDHAEELVKLEKVKVIQREVEFKVEVFEELCFDPLTEEELSLVPLMEKKNQVAAAAKQDSETNSETERKNVQFPPLNELSQPNAQASVASQIHNFVNQAAKPPRGGQIPPKKKNDKKKQTIQSSQTISNNQPVQSAEAKNNPEPAQVVNTTEEEFKHYEITNDFPTSDDLKTWMISQNAVEGVDYKDAKKSTYPNNTKCLHLWAKPSFVSRINGIKRFNRIIKLKFFPA